MSRKTHTAIATTTLGEPLSAIQVPTPSPTSDQVLIRNLWTCSTPLDLHQHDSHFLVTPPQILGDCVAGVVVSTGPQVKRLKPGDHVFGFTWRTTEEKAHQEYVLTSENLLGKIPAGFSMQAVASVPDNFVTILNVLVVDFGMELPWPKPEDWTPADKDEAVLVWGGSSSTGQYAVQILKWLGYTNIITVASQKHHDKLKRYGAKLCVDYRSGTEDTVRRINEYQRQTLHKPIKYILDCIGSQTGSMHPLSQIAQQGSTVAVLLPVILKHAASNVRPEYTFDVATSAPWSPGVETKGVRTHLYLNNAMLAEKAQAEIMPAALELGIIEPNELLLVEGSTLLERAEKAMGMLRDRVASGQRLVWRVADEI